LRSLAEPASLRCLAPSQQRLKSATWPHQLRLGRRFAVQAPGRTNIQVDTAQQVPPATACGRTTSILARSICSQRFPPGSTRSTTLHPNSRIHSDSKQRAPAASTAIPRAQGYRARSRASTFLGKSTLCLLGIDQFSIVRISECIGRIRARD
jgi:hypothetical protein